MIFKAPIRTTLTIAITLIIFLTGLIASKPASAQQAKRVNLYDSAHVYYEKKDFKKAYYFYDAYYSDTTHGQSNYDTYYTAVAGCLSGQTEKIGYYLRRSAEIGYDLSSYDTFATDPLAACLRQRPEWKAFIEPFRIKADSATKALKIITDGLNDTTNRINSTLLTDDNYWKQLAAKSTPEQLLKSIQSFNKYPKPKQTGFWTLYHLKANDTLTVPFLVYIPKAYDPKKASSLYVFLHGAAGGPKNFSNPAYEPANEAEFFKRAFTQNAFIIFPFAKKSFNWLVHQEAFETILKEVKHVKSLYHIDDNKVYLGGHSDGGRGAVWFAMNQASPFAAFYGICYYPSLFVGNTPLRNMHNQPPFYSISGTDDTLFPLKVVNSIFDYDTQEGGNWHRWAIKGGHGLPYRTPDSIYFVFDSLARIKRDPAPKHIIWETDNIKNGRYFWATITQLDTLAAPASWHTPLAPTLTNKEGKTGKANFNKNKSGAMEGTVNGNTITLNTSRVKGLTINFVPGLVDYTKPVKIIINGQEKFQGMFKPDKAEILDSFLKDKDRSMLTLSSFKFRFAD